MYKDVKSKFYTFQKNYSDVIKILKLEFIKKITVSIKNSLSKEGTLLKNQKKIYENSLSIEDALDKIIKINNKVRLNLGGMSYFATAVNIILTENNIPQGAVYMLLSSALKDLFTPLYNLRFLLGERLLEAKFLT